MAWKKGSIHNAQWTTEKCTDCICCLLHACQGCLCVYEQYVCLFLVVHKVSDRSKLVLTDTLDSVWTTVLPMCLPYFLFIAVCPLYSWFSGKMHSIIPMIVCRFLFRSSKSICYLLGYVICVCVRGWSVLKPLFSPHAMRNRVLDLVLLRFVCVFSRSIYGSWRVLLKHSVDGVQNVFHILQSISASAWNGGGGLALCICMCILIVLEAD